MPDPIFLTIGCVFAFGVFIGVLVYITCALSECADALTGVENELKKLNEERQLTNNLRYVRRGLRSILQQRNVVTTEQQDETIIWQDVPGQD